LPELRLHLESSLAPLLDLELQDLTGLDWAASGRCPFPPEVAVRHTAPFRVLGEQRGQRLWIALIQCLGRGAKLIDHAIEYRTKSYEG